MAMASLEDGRVVEGSRGFLSHQDCIREFDQCSVPEKTDAFCICGTGTLACDSFKL